jgi:cell division septation protein DedD
MSQKTNSMIKLALVFFICLLSFSIGTYVGKKYSDNQHKLAQLEPNKKGAHDTAGTEFAANTDSASHEEGHGEAGHGTIAKAEHGEKAEGDSQKLTDSEVAKIAEEFASDSTVTADSAHEKAIHSTDDDEKPIKSIAAEKPTHTTAAVKPMPAKPNVAATAATSHEREPSSIPQTKETTTGGANYTVQIGSFPSEADAQKLTKEMLAKGIKTSYVSAQVKGQTYFRVNVGFFGTAKEADEYKKDFLEKTKLTSAFVQKVQ